MNRWFHIILLAGLLALPMHGFSHWLEQADETPGQSQLHCPVCHHAQTDDVLPGTPALPLLAPHTAQRSNIETCESAILRSKCAHQARAPPRLRT